MKIFKNKIHFQKQKSDEIVIWITLTFMLVYTSHIIQQKFKEFYSKSICIAWYIKSNQIIKMQILPSRAERERRTRNNQIIFTLTIKQTEIRISILITP